MNRLDGENPPNLDGSAGWSDFLHHFGDAQVCESQLELRDL